jgi:hypothetical protein
MGTRFVVRRHPNIEIILQLVDGSVDLLAERHAIELVEHGSMEPLADSIRLRALGLGPGMIDVLDGELELVVVMLGVAAILGATIRHYPAQDDAVLFEERQHRLVCTHRGAGREYECKPAALPVSAGRGAGG